MYGELYKLDFSKVFTLWELNDLEGLPYSLLLATAVITVFIRIR